MSTPEARLPSGLIVSQAIVNERTVLPDLEPQYRTADGHLLVLRETTRVPDNSARMIQAMIYTTKHGLAVLVSSEETRKFGLLRHVSVTFKNRYPSWREVLDVKRLFYGDHIDAFQMMPKGAAAESPTNRTFHLWQAPQDWDLT